MIQKEEYQDRIKKLAERMRSSGLDGVILTADSNIDYFSGFRHHAPWTLFARPFFQIISADGRSALLTHTFLEPEMRRTAAVNDIRTFKTSGDAPVSQVREIMDEFGVKRGKVGMELGYEQRLGISLNDFRNLEAELKGITIVDASKLFWSLRTIKSTAEIKMMRQSAAVTSAAFAAAFNAAKPGMTDAQVCKVCAETMVEHGAERPGFILVTSGRENYHILSGKPTNRKLHREEMIWIDMGAVVDGYWSDFCRAAYFGKPKKELEDGQKLILDVNDAMIDATCPGKPLREVAEAAEKSFRAHGLDIQLGSGRVGHGMGLMSTEPPHVALYEETVCEEGLIFTIEPRVTNEHGVFNCEELLLVTKSGVEVLTDSPRHITYIQ